MSLFFTKKSEVVKMVEEIYSYRVDFDGKLMEGNRKRFLELKENNFYREKV